MRAKPVIPDCEVAPPHPCKPSSASSNSSTAWWPDPLDALLGDGVGIALRDAPGRTHAVTSKAAVAIAGRRGHRQRILMQENHPMDEFVSRYNVARYCATATNMPFAIFVARSLCAAAQLDQKGSILRDGVPTRAR
jgi:hypothetical protein